MQHVSNTLPVSLQGFLHLAQETGSLGTFLNTLAFLLRKVAYSLFKFLCTLTTRECRNHFLVESIAFQLRVKLLNLILQSVNLIKESLHILPFLWVGIAQSLCPQVGVLMQRSFWFHLLSVKVNLTAYCESIDLSVGRTELL